MSFELVTINCWYCGKICREEKHFSQNDPAHPGQVHVGFGGIRLLSGDYAHYTCQSQVKPGKAYKSAKASYQAWMRRNDKKVMKYLNDPRIKVSITYFGDKNNGK